MAAGGSLARARLPNRIAARHRASADRGARSARQSGDRRQVGRRTTFKRRLRQVHDRPRSGRAPMPGCVWPAPSVHGNKALSQTEERDFSRPTSRRPQLAASALPAGRASARAGLQSRQSAEAPAGCPAAVRSGLAAPGPPGPGGYAPKFITGGSPGTRRRLMSGPYQLSRRSHSLCKRMSSAPGTASARISSTAGPRSSSSTPARKLSNTSGPAVGCTADSRRARPAAIR